MVSAEQQQSVWRSKPALVVADELPRSVDDLVVGAGITGLVTGLLLARSGRSVAVVDARTIGAGTTGASSAKVSLLQGTRLSDIARRHPHEIAAAYLEANREGQSWLATFCATHDVPFQERRAVTFAQTESAVPELEREFATEQALGLGSTWTNDLDAPFPAIAGIVLPGQAQTDPMALCEVLAGEIRKRGGAICSGHRVTALHAHKKRVEVRFDHGMSSEASHVVLATGTPIMDRGLHFAKLQPHRSYVLALSGASAPDGMYLSSDDPVVSVRDVPDRGMILVGGHGHVTGRAASEKSNLETLRSWASAHFPGASEEYAWSAQDYVRYDGLPEVSTLPGTASRVHVATGYAKWGFTNAVAAALTIAADVLGDKPDWAVRLAERGGAKSLIDLGTFNGEVAWQLATDLPRTLRLLPDGKPREGEGLVGHQGAGLVGVSTVDGRTTRVRPLCTHLGGVLCWNDAARSWDCPLHGSRFTSTGDVIEGPAVRPLQPK